METLLEVRSCIFFALSSELALELWDLGRELSELGLESGVIESAAKTLSDGFSDLCVAILRRSRIAGGVDILRRSAVMADCIF